MRTIAAYSALLIALLGYSKFVWQSGFDQGSDVAICVSASFQSSHGRAVVKMAKDPACERAKRYERNPLWQLRRRGGGE